MEDIEAGSAPTHLHRVPARRSGQKTVAELLRQLDAREKPGITDTVFSVLFCRCQCGLVTTQRAFDDHTCIVDLSDDD
jgi:hypothetical protein